MSKNKKDIPYLSIEEIINFIAEEDRVGIFNLVQDNKSFFDLIESKRKNQNTFFSYDENILDNLNYTCALHGYIEKTEKINYKLSDALKMTLIDYFEKKWLEDFLSKNEGVNDFFIFKNSQLSKYGIHLSENNLNSLGRVSQVQKLFKP